MKALNQDFKNASVVLTGGVGLLLVVGGLIRQATPYGEMSPVPGLSFLMGLGWPVLCIWAGMFLRQWFRNPSWWVQALVACATVFCLYESRHSLAWWDTLPCQYLMCIGAGYLVPEGMSTTASGRKGWEYLMLLMAAAFCYTAESVVAGRLQWHPWAFGVEHEDMKRLTQWLLLNCEPLLILLAGYFAVMFSFSQSGQWLGSRDWFCGMCVTLIVTLFLASLSNSVQLGFRRLFWTYFLQFLVQPVTLYLVVVICRIIRKLRKKTMPWKEVFAI